MIINILLLLLIGAAAFCLFVYLASFHPRQKQEEKVFCSPYAPLLDKNSEIKVMSWNVQFMAGKGYFFWFEPLDNSGPDLRPATENIVKTINEVASVISREEPDIILLQEVDDGAKRTDRQDQLEKLLEKLPADYCCHSSCFYWKTAFLPHPKVMGATGMKLSVISRFRISRSIRHSLPLMPENWVVREMGIKRAVLETRLPCSTGSELVVMNTHLEAYSQGYDTLEQQVEMLRERLHSLDDDDQAWIIGGDFNLLPPGQYHRLDEKSREEYRPESEIEPLYGQFSVIPSVEQIDQNEKKWFTSFSNDPEIPAPNRTIDYLIHSKQLSCQSAHVDQQEGFNCSDHAPIVAIFSFSSSQDSGSTR